MYLWPCVTVLTCLLALQRAQFSAALKQDPERRTGDLGTEVDGQTLHLSTASQRLSDYELLHTF